MGRNPPANAREASAIPGSGRCFRGENGNPLQCSCLGNPMDRGVWLAIAHRFVKSGTPLKQISMRPGAGQP